MAESRHSVLFPLPSGLSSECDASGLPKRIGDTVLSGTCAFDDSVFGLDLLESPRRGRLASRDFTMKHVYPAPAPRSTEGRTCTGLKQCFRMGPLKRDEEDWITAATESLKRETDFAVAEERQV